ncbi:endothelin-converting enzyme 1 [Copidosoma floridanum]|uniref:endothelin-converting enzyme 1 n=1 Tax=Copidosoma floridanum TaxID=29053 RepID=UPI0006C98674|nr:endothelin-converting enzyme 1 [Copidosoma floridanum]
MMLKIRIIFVHLLGSIVVASPIFNEGGKMCDSERCKQSAEIIKGLINKEADPCNNFYNYVCGSWAANYPIPDGVDVWNSEKIVENNVKFEVKDILEGDDEEDSDNFLPLKYERLWYRSCMDLDQIEEDGMQVLKTLLGFFGGWPIAMNVSEWGDEDHDWQGIHEYYSGFKDLSPIFDIVVAPDDRNASQNVINLNKPTETLYDHLLENEGEDGAKQKYLEFIKGVVSALTVDHSLSDEDVTKDAENILVFERSLHQIKITANKSENLEPSRTYMSIKDLQGFYDKEAQTSPTASIDWLKVISVVFEDLENITLNDSEDIGIEDISYFHQLAQLLNETPNRVIVNYVHWKFVASSIKYTNKVMRDLYFQAITKEGDFEKTIERWEECIADMKLGIGYRYEYVSRHLSEETKKMVTDIASDMRGEMLDEVGRSSWLDDETKEQAMVKLHSLKWHIGVSNFYLKREFIEHIYDGFMITSNYLENELNAREFLADRNLKRLRHHQIYSHVKIDPLEAKTSYDSSRNMLVVTAAQLSVPWLHSSLPPSVNYGYLAPSMGQLMSRTMEKEVNTSTYIPPWSKYNGDMYKTYDSKTDCLTKQYYNYSVGPSTTDENMYDAIGLKVAYHAFQNSFGYESVEKLPNLEDFSNDQLFFISFALKYCQTETEKYLTEHPSTFYTPNKYRVVGTLSNFQDFSDAFKCPLNSPMNPENKCIV